MEIAGGTFEGLFVRALKVEGPIVAKLRAVGFDPTRLETQYPVEVWKRSLEVAAAAYYPELSAHDGEFQLGVRLVEGYLTTIIGRMIAVTLPFLSPDTLCLRLPRMFSTGVVGMEKMPIVTKVGPQHYTVQLFGDQGVPWFTAGSVDAVLRTLRVTPHVKVLTVNAGDFTVDITWT